MIAVTNNGMGKKQNVVVMIPAYNEAAHIEQVVKGVPREVNGRARLQVLVMDDHSSDGTAEKAVKAGAEHVLRQKHNVGLGRNFKKGIEAALKLGADIIVNIDGDGQFDPAEIPKLIRPILNQEADMVTCSRFLDKELTSGMPLSRKIGNYWFTKLVSRVTGHKFTDTQCGFRAYSREAALRLNLQGKFTYTQEVFIDLVSKGLRIQEIPLRVKYHRGRRSSISGNLRRYGFRSLGIIAKATRDTKPLSFFGLPALIIFIVGLLGGLFSLGFWLYTQTTTPIRMLLFSSLFLIVFGLSLGILALVADMLRTIHRTQGEVLYRMKKAEFSPNGNIFNDNGKVERVRSR